MEKSGAPVPGLVISRDGLKRMVDHCLAGYPDEACGVLGGRDGRVGKVYCMTNARPGPVSYEMDPEEQFRVLNDLRQEGLDLIGIFHSHPGGRAYPSAIDVEKAYWPGTSLPNYPEAVYVIVSLRERQAPDVRGFSIVDGTVAEVPVLVI